MLRTKEADCADSSPAEYDVADHRIDLIAMVVYEGSKVGAAFRNPGAVEQFSGFAPW